MVIFMHQNTKNEVNQIEQELKHLGSCTTAGLTNKKIAQLDERFFLAIDKLKRLKVRRDQK